MEEWGGGLLVGEEIGFFGEDDCPEGRVEGLGIGEDVVLVGFTEGSVVAEKRINEFMCMLVSFFIRKFTCFEKRQSNFLTSHRITMLTVIQNSNTKF